jgi:glycosidase
MGGDLAGIEQNLDYFSDLGITALWFTPVLENNMTAVRTTAMLLPITIKVDPRFGTNEEYQQLISKCHDRGIKIVMDMIFNHCGVRTSMD